ncbi:MAG TPA: hypothetical protein PLR83_00960 [Pyrinomonadaceae bacterium]|nr:hypothetical protein [Pyrinomonadaceae bacterium]
MNVLKRIQAGLASALLLLASGVFMPAVKASVSTKETATVVKLTLPGGQWIEARVIGEGFLKIKNDATGQIIGFSMQVLDSKNGIVRVQSLESNDGTEGSFRVVESLDVSLKTPKTTSVMQAINVEVVAIVEQLTEAKSKEPGEVGSLRPPECCVTCGEITACANCRVTMSCGSCHTELCP